MPHHTPLIATLVGGLVLAFILACVHRVGFVRVVVFGVGRVAHGLEST